MPRSRSSSVAAAAVTAVGKTAEVATSAAGGAKKDTNAAAATRVIRNEDLADVSKKDPSVIDEEPIPDDFFADFENEKFIEGLVESSILNARDRDDDDDDANDADSGGNAMPPDERDMDDDDDDLDRRSRSPMVENCLKEIELESLRIRRRRRKLARELERNENFNREEASAERRARSHLRRSRSRSRSPTSRRHGSGGGSSRDEYKQKSNYSSFKSRSTASSRHGAGGRSRSRSRTPSAERRTKSYQRLNNNHSNATSSSSASRRAGGSSSTSASISFLDELEQEFARQGKQFPEKEMLLQQKRMNGGQLRLSMDDGVGPLAAKRHCGMADMQQQQQQQHMPQQQHQHPMQMQQHNLPYMQQHPPQQISYAVTSGLMAAANAIIPPLPLQQQLLQPQPMVMYATTGQPAMYASPINTGLLPTPGPMSDCPMIDLTLPLPAPMPLTIIPDLSPTAAMPPAHVRVKIKSLQQSKAAIRLLCQAENHVPKMQFIFTRTSVKETSTPGIGDDSTAPIRSAKNVTFGFTDTTALSTTTDGTRGGLTAASSKNMPGRLAPRLRHITKVLGFNSEVLVAAARMKSQAQQVMDTVLQANNAFSIGTGPASAAASHSNNHQAPPPKMVPPPAEQQRQQQHRSYPEAPRPTSRCGSTTTTSRSVHAQTGPPEPCARCATRDALRCNARETQTDASPKQCNIKTQTIETATSFLDGAAAALSCTPTPSNGSSSSDAIGKTLQLALSRMTVAQLMAMNDFARIICEPRPANSVEMFTLREQLYDVYNLSQRDDETVRLAERDKLTSVRNLLAAATAAKQQQQQPLSAQLSTAAAAASSVIGPGAVPVVPVVQAPSASSAVMKTRQEYAMLSQLPHQRHLQPTPMRPAWTPNTFDWGAGGGGGPGGQQSDGDDQWRYQQHQQRQQRGAGVGGFNTGGGDLTPHQPWMGQPAGMGPWSQNPRPGNWQQQQQQQQPMQPRGAFGPNGPNVQQQRNRPF